MYQVCCGIDLHKDSIVACVLSGPLEQEAHSDMLDTGTMHSHLLQLASWLAEHDCTHVAMESTGCFWQPLFNVLTDAGIECAVINSSHAKNLPGRKTDWNDAYWIAHLYRHGMLRPSLVPSQALQTLRNFTRSMETLVQDRTREVNRIEKLLQATGFKLSSVLTDILSATGRRFLEVLIRKGRITGADVRALRDHHCKTSVDAMALAVQGTMREHDRRLLDFKLRQVNVLDAQIQELDAMTQALIEPYSQAIEILDSIPGIGHLAATEIVAEIGTDMAPFRTGEQLASWAGLSPGSNESAGKKKPHTSFVEIGT